jgi:acyl carrier protein
MAYFRPDVFNSVKRIMLDKYPYIPADKITRNASFTDDLGLDSLDKLELLIEFTNQHKLNVKNIQKFEHVHSIGDFCDLLYNYLNPSTQVETKQQVFEILNKYLQEELHITNATPESRLTKDLNLTYTDRMNLIWWIEYEFDIRLPYMPFKNLDALCEKILKRVKKRKFALQRNSEPLIYKIKNKISSGNILKKITGNTK